MYNLWLIYRHVAECRFCVVSCVIIRCFPFLLSNYSTYVLLIFFLCLCACFVCLLHTLYILLLYCFVYYFCISIYVPFLFLYKFIDHCHRVGTQQHLINIVSNISYRIVSSTISHHIISCIISHRIVSYSIASHRIASYHVSNNISYQIKSYHIKSYLISQSVSRKISKPAEICQCATNNNRLCTTLLGGRLRPRGWWGRR